MYRACQEPAVRRRDVLAKVLQLTRAAGGRRWTTCLLLAVPVAVGPVVLIWTVSAVAADLIRGKPPGSVLVVVLVLSVLPQTILKPALDHVLGTIERRINAEFFKVAGEAFLAPRTVESLSTPEVQAIGDRVNGRGSGKSGPGQSVTALVRVLLLTTQCGGFVGSLLLYFPLVGLLSTATWSAIALFNRRHEISDLQAREKAAAAIRHASYLGGLPLSRDHAHDVQLYTLVDYFSRRYRDAWWAAMNPIWNQRRAVLVRTSAWAIALAASLTLQFYLVSVQAPDKPTLAIGVQAVLGTAALMTLNSRASTATGGLRPVRALLELTRTLPPPPLTVRPSPAHSTAGSNLPGTPALDVTDLHYTYPNATRSTINGISLTVARGQFVAVVGPNGAGKTTFLDLCLGLRTPDRGTVRIAGHSARHIDPGDKHLAVMFQHPIRFESSVSANIAPAAGPELPDDLTWHLLERVGLADRVRRLPDGLATILSPEYTRGAGLSGGQWQRLAWARALHRVDQGAELLLLDEPTSGLDLDAEAQFLGQLHQLPPHLSILLVSHRVTTVTSADRIIVIEDGHVVDDGSPDELARRPGYHADQFALELHRVHGDR